VNTCSTEGMSARLPAARICCLDLDTFFVSVERLLDPSLVGKPVVVGGRKGSRGVVTAASYEVRAFGVRSGMPMNEASRRAPHAVFLPTRHGVYSPWSRKVKAILERICPVVQTASIDEYYLDWYGCERMLRQIGDRDDDAAVLRTVRQLRQRIQDELGLPASVGIGATRAIAKMASRDAKPAGVFMVPLGQERAYVRDLPVRAFPGIGPVAESRLKAAGLHTLGQLVELPPGPLLQRFQGPVCAVRQGIDPVRCAGLGRDRPAFREHDPVGVDVGSISNERTFMEDPKDPASVLEQLRALSERVAWRARGRGVRARTVTLKLRWSDFHTITRSRTIPPTFDEQVIHQVALELYRAAATRDLPVRLIGVGLSKLEAPSQQLALPFDHPKRPSAGEAIDAVRERFGYDAIRLGSTGKGKTWVA
jgi:DNA polymerase-4